MFIKSVCNELKKERIAEIKTSLAVENVKKDKINEYIKSVGKIDDTVKIVLSKNDKFEKCFLFEKIEKDINKYFETCSFFYEA
jgi:hypothetical protein